MSLSEKGVNACDRKSSQTQTSTHPKQTKHLENQSHPLLPKGKERKGNVQNPSRVWEGMFCYSYWWKEENKSNRKQHNVLLLALIVVAYLQDSWEINGYGNLLYYSRSPTQQPAQQKGNVNRSSLLRRIRVNILNRKVYKEIGWSIRPSLWLNQFITCSTIVIVFLDSGGQWSLRQVVLWLWVKTMALWHISTNNEVLSDQNQKIIMSSKFWFLFITNKG